VSPRVEVRGREEVLRRLEGIAQRIEEPKAAADALTAIFRARYQKRWEAGGEGDWPELKQNTLERKARSSTARTMDRMRWTDALFDAMTGGRAGAGGRRITYAAEIPYYAFIVGRRFPLLKDDDAELLEEVVKVLGEHIIAERGIP
jgi:phage gpG-like protein